MRKSFLITLLVSLFLTGIYVTAAVATQISLNDFFADPTVLVAPDGSNALMTEDPFFSSVLLSNDPGLGDPNVIIPQAGFDLIFDYVFTEGTLLGENDEFGVFILDGFTGGSMGAPYEFFTDSTSAGTISFDLTGLVGQTLGLQFELNALPGDIELGSWVEISNLRIEEATVIPEPSTIFLLGLGLLTTAGVSRKKFFS